MCLGKRPLPAGDTGAPWLTTDDPTPFVYIHPDPLGSAWLVTEGKTSAIHAGIRYTQGQIVQRYTYGPFGATRFLLNPNGGAPTPAHAALLTTPAYTGHRALPGLGLVTTPARDLDPTWGRFLTPDPVVADPTDAQAYHRYAYARNNPFRYTDPTGHFETPDMFGEPPAAGGATARGPAYSKEAPPAPDSLNVVAATTGTGTATVVLAANPLDNALIAAIDLLGTSTRVTLTEPQTGRTIAVFETPAGPGAQALGALLGPIADLARGLDYQTVAFRAATRGDAFTAMVYEYASRHNLAQGVGTVVAAGAAGLAGWGATSASAVAAVSRAGATLATAGAEAYTATMVGAASPAAQHGLEVVSGYVSPSMPQTAWETAGAIASYTDMIIDRYQIFSK